MAGAGTLGDFKIYQKQFWGGWTEVAAQNANAFNGASGGTITLRTATHRGQFVQESFITEIANLVSRRDGTSVAAINDLKTAQGELVRPKVDRKIGPVADTMDKWRKIRDGGNFSNEEFSFVLGQQYAKAVMLEQLNLSLGICANALKAQTANYLDIATTDKPMSYGGGTDSGLIQLNAKLGDAASRIICYVMHSVPFFALMKDGAANYKMTNVAGATIVQGAWFTMGKLLIVTDSAALTLANQGSTTNKTGYLTLALQAGAIDVAESEEREIVTDVLTGYENLLVRLQGEYAYTVGLMGMRYDTTKGANPADATIQTGTNWVKEATSYKNLPGACCLSL